MTTIETINNETDPKQLEKLINILNDFKAQDTEIIDVRKKSSITEYFIISTGTSQKHVQSLAENLVEKAKSEGIDNFGFEGKVDSDWIAIDFGFAFVHIMQEEARNRYALDKLWKDK